MKRILLFISSLLVAGSLAFAPVLAYAAEGDAAATQQSVCEGIGIANGVDSCETDTGGATVGGIIHTVINILSWLIGIIAIIVIIFGGMRYVTSGGDSSKVSSAKSTITYALIGIVVAALAQVLVRFVFKQAVDPVTPVTQSTVDNGGKSIPTGGGGGVN